MKNQPLPSMVSSDDVQTPGDLCNTLVRHFKPAFHVLEPCCGDGNFIDALAAYREQAGCPMIISHCEIKEGRDFLMQTGLYDWIITNPPFSQIKAFMEKSFQVADNVVFLATLNHLLGLKARLRLLDQYGFGIKETVLVDTPPPPWPASGFQVGAVHFQRGYSGPMAWTDLREGAR